jgi:hypothetical protein
VTAFRVWASSDERPVRANVVAPNTWSAAERWVEREVDGVDDGDEVVVRVEDAVGDVRQYRVVAERRLHLVATPDDEPLCASAHDLALATSIEDTLHLDELCEDAS